MMDHRKAQSMLVYMEVSHTRWKFSLLLKRLQAQVTGHCQCGFKGRSAYENSTHPLTVGLSTSTTSTTSTPGDMICGSSSSSSSSSCARVFFLDCAAPLGLRPGLLHTTGSRLSDSLKHRPPCPTKLRFEMSWTHFLASAAGAGVFLPSSAAVAAFLPPPPFFPSSAADFLLPLPFFVSSAGFFPPFWKMGARAFFSAAASRSAHIAHETKLTKKVISTQEFG
jgi:hypothetical protein